jgi:hypothetical protein
VVPSLTAIGLDPKHHVSVAQVVALANVAKDKAPAKAIAHENDLIFQLLL